MESLIDREPDEIRAAIAEARARGDMRTITKISAGLRAALVWKPEEHQLPPAGLWWMWVFQGGRGSGKTDAGADWFDKHMSGPPCDRRARGGHRGAVVGPTIGDAVSSCVTGVSGLQAHNPWIEKVGRTEGTFAVWPNGAEAQVFGAHFESDADRLRAGGNRCCWWFDETAYARYLSEAIDNVALGGRLGPRPHGIATTTPKNTPAYRRLIGLPNVVTTTASTFDNPHNPLSWIEQMLNLYEGTRLGLQELYAQLLTDYEGALWRRETIDADRLPGLDAIGHNLIRVSIGIDPSTWSPEIGVDPGTTAEGIETGIVGVAIDDQHPRPHLYVLDDESCRAAAEEWGRKAVQLYWTRNSLAPAELVPETNAGGAMVLSTIRLIDPEVKFHYTNGKPGVRAKHGKRSRAEPVSAIYDQHRVHHVGGGFPGLEAQMCGWDPTEPWSPDRIDALVYAVHALAPWKAQGGGTAYDVIASMRSPARR